MTPKDIKFSVHDYDRDGDCTEQGVFLHFGETRVKAADAISDFASIVEHFKRMRDEIESTYGDGVPARAAVPETTRRLKFVVIQYNGLHCLHLNGPAGPYIWGFEEQGKAEAMKAALNQAMFRVGCVAPDADLKGDASEAQSPGDETAPGAQG